MFSLLTQKMLKTDSVLIENLSSKGEKLFTDNISDDEEILVKLKGTFGEAFVLTNKRLYVIKWGFQAGNMFGGRCNAFEFANTTGIEHKKGLLMGTIEVQTPSMQNTQKSYWGTGSNNAVSSDNIVTFQRQKFDAFLEGAKLAREMINIWHQKGRAGSATELDSLIQLEKLSELKDKGIISDEEFREKKKQLLNL